MLELLKIEWLKFRKNTVFIVLAGLFALSFPFLILAGKEVFAKAPPPFPSSSIFYEFPTVWDYQGYVGNWLVSFFIGFIMIYSITSESANRTMRQCIINGQTRKEFFISKILIMVTISILCTIIYTGSTIVLGIIHTDGYELSVILDNNFAIIRFFLMCIGYLSFAMLLVFSIRKGILTLLLYFSYMMIVEPIGRAVLLFNYKTPIANYLPMNIIEDLMPNPMMRLPDVFAHDQIGFNIVLPYYYAIGLSLICIAVFVGLSYWVFMKRDI